MPIFHSIKQLFSNFMLLWKLIVYYLICVAVVALLYFFAVAPVVAPLVDKILETGIVDDAYKVAVHYISMNPEIETSIAVLNETAKDVSGIFLEYASSFTLAYVLLALLVFVWRFITLLKEIPLIELVKERMSTRQKGFFTGLMIQNLGRSSIYALTTMLFTVPLDAILGVLTYFIAKLFIGWLGVFGVFFGAIVLVILLSAKSTLFALCLPNVNETKKPFKGFLQGVALSARNFWRIFLYQIPFMLLILFAVTAFTFFTFGAAFWFMIPVAVLLSAIFREVLFFSAQKRNFYVDSDTIVKGRLDNDLPDMEESQSDEDVL